MKLLVFSDSHGRLGLMLDAVEKERPQRIFFLGDNYRDGEDLAAAYPDIPMDLVVGNCDVCPGPDELLVEVEGVRFLLTHGHRYHVKFGTGRLAEAGKKKGAAVVCFGHTHEALDMPKQGVRLFNPGTAGGVHNRPGYGVIVVNDGQFQSFLR